MPKKTVLIAALAAGLCAAAHAAPDAQRLYITTETSPPSSMLQDGRVTGYGADKVREIMERADIAYTMELLPWKRAYTSALQRSDACVFATTRTPEREALFKWVGPLDEAEWVLMGRAGRQYDLRTLEDARKYRIGTYNGDARDQFLRERGFNVDPAPNDYTNMRKLLLDRIDLWAASLRRGGNVLEQRGLAQKIVPVLTFDRIRVYLACNRAVPDAWVARMNTAADAMQRDGTMRRIERKYDTWTAAAAD